MSDLASQKCVSCSVGAPTLGQEEIKENLKKVDSWNLTKSPDKINKNFEFTDFQEAVDFINKVAKLAEQEGHHPNIFLHDYKNVEITLWTHKINGLHQNDFIMASKIDRIVL